MVLFNRGSLIQSRFSSEIPYTAVLFINLSWELQLRIISTIDRIDKQYSFHRASTAPLLDAPANPNLKIPTRRTTCLTNFPKENTPELISVRFHAHCHGHTAGTQGRYISLCASNSNTPSWISSRSVDADHHTPTEIYN